MQKVIMVFVLTLLTSTVSAQYPKDDIKQNIRCSASNDMAYPGPKHRKLTPAPQDKHPFYISHYGRYGSCYLAQKEEYETPYEVLAAADKAGKLTPKGLDVKQRLDKIRNEAHNQWGELTPLGARQQQLIAQRMVERFPEVFEDRTPVDARSTTMTRCILTMEQFLVQLARMRPNLKIHHNATQRDMYYLNQLDRHLMDVRMDSATQAVYDKFSHHHEKYDKLMLTLFNDMVYVKQHIDASQLNNALFRLAGSLHNTELRLRVTLYDLFTDNELYHNWMKENAWWYINYGACTLNGKSQPFSQRNLLHKLISDADSCLKLKKPGVQLRFGHDTDLMPLACLMDINHWGLATDHLEKLGKKGWMTYRIIPTSANLQLIFYRSNPDDEDIWVKVLYNEDEAILPLPDEHAPYYRWSDFRTYYLNKLDNYEKH